MNRETIFSPDRLYRYTLWREWLMVGGLHDQRFVQFIGLNPSTADETNNDPTILKCIQYAKDWGFGAMCMTNIFAWRDTIPEKMKLAGDPVGPDNDRYLISIASEAGLIIAAWGKHGSHRGRGVFVKNMMSGELHCLAVNKNGSPKHPLYLKSDLRPILL